jgi:hypothetical protein
MEVIGHSLGAMAGSPQLSKITESVLQKTISASFPEVRITRPSSTIRALCPVARRTLGILPVFVSTFDRFQPIRRFLASWKEGIAAEVTPIPRTK